MQYVFSIKLALASCYALNHYRKCGYNDAEELTPMISSREKEKRKTISLVGIGLGSGPWQSSRVTMDGLLVVPHTLTTGPFCICSRTSLHIWVSGQRTKQNMLIGYYHGAFITQTERRLAPTSLYEHRAVL